MTDNFEVFRNYMLKNDIPMYQKDMGDLFFQILLVRRGKDHPNLPAANYMFKVYYMFLLNSMFGFEQYMKNNNNEYYVIGMNLYYQSKYLNQNMDELTKVLKKRMMEVL